MYIIIFKSYLRKKTCRFEISVSNLHVYTYVICVVTRRYCLSLSLLAVAGVGGGHAGVIVAAGVGGAVIAAGE